MNTYFKNVTSLDDLKSQWKTYAKANHPDVGGDPEVMKAINAEYDRLFPIWQKKSQGNNHETAESTRSEFYSENGWKGDNYSSHRDLKDVAAIVRSYVKENYPGCKFSVSMDRRYNSLSVTLKEAPWWPYTEGFTPDRFGTRFTGTWDKGEFSPEAKAVLGDVVSFVNSYNLEDIDYYTDYFRVGFWFHGVTVAGDFRQVEQKVRKAKKASAKADDSSLLGNEYDIQKTVHTKTREDIWVVKVLRNLSKEEYKAEAAKMKALGGYYSKYVHGFVFRADPAEALAAA